MLVYEDFDNVINCVNPCLGEYYIDIDGKYRPTIFYREFINLYGLRFILKGVECRHRFFFVHYRFDRIRGSGNAMVRDLTLSGIAGKRLMCIRFSNSATLMT